MKKYLLYKAKDLGNFEQGIFMYDSTQSPKEHTKYYPISNANMLDNTGLGKWVVSWKIYRAIESSYTREITEEEAFLEIV